MRKKKKGRQRNRRSEQAYKREGERREWENESSALFWGSYYNIGVGLSVSEHLQNVCVRAQLWVFDCGLSYHLRCSRIHVCFVYAPGSVSGWVLDLQCK